jgi:hypothetical protein
MKQTAVEWLSEQLLNLDIEFDSILINRANYWVKRNNILEKAKEMEKENTDNKVIHFAEWLTKKHSYTLMALYEHFEEEFYNDKL